MRLATRCRRFGAKQVPCRSDEDDVEPKRRGPLRAPRVDGDPAGLDELLSFWGIKVEQLAS